MKKLKAAFAVLALGLGLVAAIQAPALASTTTLVPVAPTTTAVDSGAPAGAAEALLAPPSNCIGQKICFYAESLGRGAVNLVNTTGCQNFPANWNDAVTSIWNTYNTGSYVVHVYMDSNCLTPNGDNTAKSLYPQDDVQLNNEWGNAFHPSGFDDQITSFKICAMPCSP